MLNHGDFWEKNSKPRGYLELSVRKCLGFDVNAKDKSDIPEIFV